MPIILTIFTTNITMYISQHKIKFALEKALSLIKNAESYSISIYNGTIDSTMRFNTMSPKKGAYPSSHDSVNVEFQHPGGKVTSVEIKIYEGGDLKIIESESPKELKPIFDKVRESGYERIKDLEEQKFLKMFPDYDVATDRDLKLEELFSKQEEPETPIAEPIKVAPPVKKWGLF